MRLTILRYIIEINHIVWYLTIIIFRMIIYSFILAVLVHWIVWRTIFNKNIIIACWLFLTRFRHCCVFPVPTTFLKSQWNACVRFSASVYDLVFESLHISQYSRYASLELSFTGCSHFHYAELRCNLYDQVAVSL